mgnify:CR=1 FL=1
MQTSHATVEVQKQGMVQNAPRPIIVTGERVYNFTPFHWRQAIRQYLACIWTNHFSGQETIDLTIPTDAPSLRCGPCQVTLRYHAVSPRYEAFGMHDDGIPPSLRNVCEGSVLRVTVTANEPERMESALARFAWNHQMRVLGISLPDCRYMEGFWLWSYPGYLKELEKPRDC